MRKVILFTAAAIALVLPQCATQQKVAYDFPPEMAQNIRNLYLEQCEKGRVLYELNCAKCHNTIVKRKTIIPDWTLEQLKGYELRVTNPQHEEGLPETHVSAEELGQIMTFLMYKKKNK